MDTELTTNKVKDKQERWVRLDQHPDRQTKNMLGRRVRMTEAGVKAGLVGRAHSRFGVVTRVTALSGEYIRVRRDGIKSYDEYAASFWEARV